MTTKINKEKIKNFLKILLIISILFLVYLIIFLNLTNVKQVSDDNKYIKQEKKIIIEQTPEVEIFVEIDLNDIDWIEYKTKNYNVTFQYPSDFKLIKDEIRVAYKNEKTWDEIFFKSYNRKQKTFFNLKINPDGIGLPIDKKFTVVNENGIKQVILEKVYNYPKNGDGILDDERMVLSAYWKEGEDWLWFIFSYQIDTELDNIDYEQMFIDIIESIKTK